MGVLSVCSVFFFQAEDGIRYLVRSRGLGDVYKRQTLTAPVGETITFAGVYHTPAAVAGAAEALRLLPALSLIHI